MKGLLVILLAGGVTTLASVLSTSEAVQAWSPMLALCTGMGVLIAWLVATDDYHPDAAAGTHKRAA